MDQHPLNRQGIVIIGGGPAGIATALALAQRGIHSTLLDAPATRVKTGETLPPDTRSLVRALQIEPALQDERHLPCYGNRYSWGDETIREKQFLFSTNGNGWHLDREYFEKTLWAIARERNISCIGNCRVTKITQHASGEWELLGRRDGKEQIITASFLVDATGRNAKVARSTGMRRISYDALTGIAARFIIDNPEDLSRLTHIQAVENGWWYAALVSGNTIVTVYMTDAGLADPAMQKLPGYWAMLEKAPLIRSLFPGDYKPGAATLQVQSAATGHLEKVYGHNWLATGDAAYSYDPISSYGITSALGSGYYAGHAIADHLSGQEEALPAYQYVTGKAFTDYLFLWEQQYRQEGRWPQSPFWKKWHGKAVA